MAMLHLLYNCLSGNTSAKKMFFKIHILYIDEGSIYDQTSEKREQNRRLLIDTCNSYKFNLTIVPLESVYDINLDTENVIVDDLESDKYKNSGSQLTPFPHEIEVVELVDKTQKLQKLLQTLDSGFAADLVYYLKKWIIADFCLKHDFKRVFLGTSGHKVASQLLS